MSPCLLENVFHYAAERFVVRGHTDSDHLRIESNASSGLVHTVFTSVYTVAVFAVNCLSFKTVGMNFMNSLYLNL
jgi:hypothetical protein